MDETLLTLIPLLGHSFSRDIDEKLDDEENDSVENDHFRDIFEIEPSSPCDGERPMSSFPSFSLDHPENLVIGENQTKEETQLQASSLLAQPIFVDHDHEGTKQIRKLPQMMVENLYASFDRLVDARILAYSKILSNHILSLTETGAKENSNRDNDFFDGSAHAAEYKLKTLLEIGTNIHADSVVSTFVRDGEPYFEKREDKVEIITYPLLLNFEIKDLHIPSADEGNSKAGDVEKNFGVFFQSRALLQGIFTADASERLLQAVQLEVDCDTLLRCMIEEASKVVSEVVERTNEAWSRKGHGSEEADAESANSVDQNLPDTNQVSPELCSSPSPPSDAPIVSLSLGCGGETHASPTENICFYHDSTPQPENEFHGTFSVENISTIVDYTLGEIDENLMGEPAHKKQRRAWTM